VNLIFIGPCIIVIDENKRPTTPKHQHTWNQEHATNVLIQQNSRKLLMMDIVMSETC